MRILFSILAIWILSAHAVPQFFGGTNENAIVNGQCADVTFVYARGSTDSGNMGTNIGPQVCTALKRKLPSVGCQGVGGAYTGSLSANAVPITGTTASYAAEGQRMLRLAASRCPRTQITAGGYSQGAALMAEAVARLDSSTKSRISAVILYGWLENSRNRGQIPNFPSSRTRIFCSATDTVCSGSLIVSPAHFVYQTNGDSNRGADFLASRVRGGY